MNRRTSISPRLLVAALCVLCSAAGAADGTAQARADTLGPARPILAIFGRVHVDSLRFVETVPGDVTVRFTGNATDTLAHAVRTNLPRPGGLLSQTVNTLGQTVARTVNEAGTLTESVLGTAGNVVSQRSLGSVKDLTDVVSETTNQAGQTVRRVRDQAGNVIEYTLDRAGNVTAARGVR